VRAALAIGRAAAALVHGVPAYALTVAIGLMIAGVAARPGTAAAASQAKAADPAVRELLQQYATALESLDADAVKKVQPSIDVEGLKRAFREMRSLEVEIDNIRLLSADGATARVSCRVAQTLTPKAGSRQTTTVTRVLRLRRDVTGWIIQAFER
jgi:hypothetical protein